MQTEIPLKDIKVSDRLRKDYGDVEELADSIETYGLLQPLVLDKANNLIAGGRRYAACTLLNLEKVPVFYKETTSESQKREMEVVENVQRKEMSWQERCFGIEEVHKLRRRENALVGAAWGMRETGALLGIKGVANVKYALEIAAKLHSEQDENGQPKPSAVYWKCSTMSEAWSLRMRQQGEELLASMAKEQTSSIASTSDDVSRFIGMDEGKDEGTTYANIPEETIDLSNPTGVGQPQATNPPATLEECQTFPQAEAFYKQLPDPKPEFDEWWFSVRLARQRQLSLGWIHNVDCIDFMFREENKERFDHIITDPPYGIDMDMLDQQNTGMKNIDIVEEEHQVKDNAILLAKFVKSAYQCLKPNSFFIMWADQMWWQFLYDAGVDCGFKVQRWPITWCKTHPCMNQAATFNFTKATEIAIVMRKGLATLPEPIGKNYILAGHDDFKEQLGHPFVKPFEAWEFLIKSVSIEGQLILEPFSGRGSGVISMLRMNRKVISCEKDTEHFNALVNNIKNHYLSINPNFTFI